MYIRVKLFMVCALLFALRLLGVPSYEYKKKFILQLIALGGPQMGLGIVNAPHSPLRRGTVYSTLSRMEEEALIVSYSLGRLRSDQELSRRLYGLTDLGRDRLKLMGEK